MRIPRLPNPFAIPVGVLARPHGPTRQCGPYGVTREDLAQWQALPCAVYASGQRSYDMKTKTMHYTLAWNRNRCVHGGCTWYTLSVFKEPSRLVIIQPHLFLHDIGAPHKTGHHYCRLSRIPIMRGDVSRGVPDSLREGAGGAQAQTGLYAHSRDGRPRYLITINRVCLHFIKDNTVDFVIVRPSASVFSTSPPPRQKKGQKHATTTQLPNYSMLARKREVKRNTHSHGAPCALSLSVPVCNSILGVPLVLADAGARTGQDVMNLGYLLSLFQCLFRCFRTTTPSSR